MTNYRPLLYSLAFIFVIAILMNAIVSPFIDMNEINPNSYLFNTENYNSTIQLLVNPETHTSISSGVSIFGFALDIPVINPYSWLPDSITTFIYNQIIIMSYIPDWLLIPMFIILGVAFLYGVIKLVFP